METTLNNAGIGRRTLLRYGAAGAVGVSALAFNQTGALAAGGGDDAELRRLYRAALNEGGGLVVWAGGSVPTQEDRTRDAFTTAFPGIDTVIKVRYSTEHSALVDRQLALGGLEPDVIQLQTLYDFDHWKARNALLPYRPPGAQAVFKQYRDPDDTFIGISAQSFGRVVNTTLLSEGERPRDATDFLTPAFRDKIVVPDPTADDAVLFAFYLVTQKYGLRFMEQFMEQRPLVVANSPTTNAILASGQRTVSLSNVSPLVPGAVQYLAPKTDQFMSWPRTAAIFRAARHPAAAKLYLAWQLTVERQRTVLQWSSRRDVAVPAGLITDYNTPLNGFRDFIRDRAAVERYRALITTFIHPSA
ncbi:ABC transporter substrate-binding protein [Kribbella sp. NPDC058245]|uniref:ABC transporter substrate-binding protein n=1 Tax=Kribbella sp. NPDC058245 TaxID=3346399 RepID=UPI0036E68D51